MFNKIAFSLILGFSSLAQASLFEEAYTEKQISNHVISEFEQLYMHVQDLEHDYVVGGILKAKKLAGFELLWSLDSDPKGYDTIRIYKKSKDDEKQGFAVTYYRGRHIIEGVNVIRRFMGPAQSGWRADTVDYSTQAYLGYQGKQSPEISADEKKILNKLGITIF